MKKNIFKTLIVFILFIDTNAQNAINVNSFKEICDYATSNFKIKYPSLTFLRHRLISPVANVFDTYQGSVNDSTLNFISYYGLVNDLDLANFNSDSKINIKYLNGLIVKSISENKVALSAALVENYKFKDEAIALNYIGFQNNKFIDNSPINYFPFDKDTLFAISPLNEIFKTNTLNFNFNATMFLSNLDINIISSKLIDYGNGSGFETLLENKTVVYPTGGTKTITIKFTINNKIFISKSKIQIETQNQMVNPESCQNGILAPNVGPINITTTKLGNFVSGKYAVWFSGCNTTQKIRKPFIISAGYNPGNGKQLLPGLFNDLIVNFYGNIINVPVLGGWNGEWRGTFYETYNGTFSKRYSTSEFSQCGEGSSNGTQLLDRLRDEGYDVIILSYDNGKDFTRNNAALFMELIEVVNQEKFTNGSFFENVVVGFSAGGLTTRMALALMESRYKQGIGPNPHTKIWINFEGENQGANVPLGFQHLLRFQSNPFFTIPSLNPIKLSADITNTLISGIAYGSVDSDNANEILAYSATDPNGNAHPNRANLLNQFANIPLNTSNGYPEFTRRIGIAQGSSDGISVPHTTDYMLDSYLGTNLSGTAVSFPSDCGGSYTWVAPSCYKSTTARWWGANNAQNIFDGDVHLDASFTYYPKQCVKILGNCKCIGPFTATIPINIQGTHIAKPNNLTTDFDDVPSSTISSHVELYKQSAYGFHNNWLNGQSSASYDPQLHGFTPTVSCLDLKNPVTGLPANNFTSPQSLGLLNIRKNINGVNIPQPDLRFGFPYLNYPINKYAATPFDAVFAIGNNNGFFINGNPKPNNQLHVEDAQTFIGDYLNRVEIAPEKLFLTNRDLASYQNNYIAEFEARDKIFIGKTDMLGNNIYGLDNNENYLTPNGDFKVSQNSNAILHAGQEIAFLPGTEVSEGASLSAYIQSYNCVNLLYRINNNLTQGNTPEFPNTGIDYEKPINKELNKKINSFLLYPNPNNGAFTYMNVAKETSSNLLIIDVSGKVFYSKTIVNNTLSDLVLPNLDNGIYLVKIVNANSQDSFKLTINK